MVERVEKGKKTHKKGLMTHKNLLYGPIDECHMKISFF